jgi:TcpE family
VDLPTYTGIWRIEKRLYKLYDFRLPMPLPIGQVTVFAAVAVPYVVILQLLGVPFNHTLIWLYILPPGLITWLVTRPVLESKRLPELIRSQLRYLAEPKVMCRMLPLAERDVVVVTGRVWRPRTKQPASAAAASALPAEAAAVEVAAADVLGPDAVNGLKGDVLDREAPGRQVFAGGVLDGAAAGLTASDVTAGRSRRPLPPGRSRALAESGVRERSGPEREARGPGRPAWPVSAWSPGQRAGTVTHAAEAGRSEPGAGPERSAVAAEVPAEMAEVPAGLAQEPANGTADPAQDSAPGPLTELRFQPSERPSADDTAPARPGSEKEAPGGQGITSAPAQPAAQAGAPGGPGSDTAPVPPRRPHVTVVHRDLADSAPPTVERALAGAATRRGEVRFDRVAVLPGGHRPGKQDLLQRDRTRARRPIGAPARIVVLGCTVGAGQTTTALLTGDMLASLRSDRVAVLDLNPGQASLIRRAEARPALGAAALLTPSRLAVIAPPRPGAHGPLAGEQDATRAEAELAFAAAADRYELVLADPATVAVPRLLGLADQLVLVAPASGAAPGAVAMTFEWLDAHRHASLAAGAIMVLNGVSRRSIAHVEQAERVCVGRCRATVRVPWDDQLQQRPLQPGPAAGAGPQAAQHWAGVVSPATAAAFTALAGVLVASLADRGERPERAPARAGASPGHGPAGSGQGRR